MPYGRRKYGRLNKEVATPHTAIATYVCGHCGHVGSTDLQYAEIMATDKNGILAYIKICPTCIKLFKEWVKK